MAFLELSLELYGDLRDVNMFCKREGESHTVVCSSTTTGMRWIAKSDDPPRHFYTPGIRGLLAY